ncbi:hypothetical protein LIER_40482 [Lithospermum erythrorhizon]|uniref:Uncharacterized protein n=1 Tax=Lithospermum erythrorhizon TaxID=34254 RepID=A0AAV3QVB5_LITER
MHEARGGMSNMGGLGGGLNVRCEALGWGDARGERREMSIDRGLGGGMSGRGLSGRVFVVVVVALALGR